MSHPTAVLATISPKKKNRNRQSLLALPLSAYLVLFFIVPFVVIFWYSFGYKPDIYTTHSNDKLSLGRYIDTLSPTFFQIFGKTLIIALVGTALVLLIGYPIAYWMATKLSPKTRGIAVALVLVPYWTNFLVRTIGWQIALNPDSFISHWLMSLGIAQQPLDILYTVGAVQLGVVYNYLPLMILPLYVTMEQLDHRLLEANRDLGGSPWSGFWRVTVPLTMPGIAAGLLLTFVPLMGDYITPSVLGGAAGTMVGQMVANQFTTAQNWALGSAMAIVLMLAILIVAMVFAVIFKILGAIVRRVNRVVVAEGSAA